MKLNPYLNFQGNCEEVINFYKDVLDGEIVMMSRFSDMPPEMCEIGDNDMNKIMHATLTFGEGQTLLFSDNINPGFNPGNNIHLSINIADEEEAEKVYNSLLEGGNATMPFAPAFWGGKFGMLTDKFGVQWMVSSAH